MSPADLQQLIPIAAEKSKVPLYVAGGLAAAWAVGVSILGIRRPDFPRTVRASRVVMGLSGLLVVATVAMAVVTAARPSKEAKAAGTHAPAGKGAGGGATGALALAADSGGGLSYDRKSLAAPAGKVTIAFANQSPVAHNVTLAQGARNVAASATITQSKTTLTAALKPGTYTFFCSVDGHRQAGMVGTLTVR